MDGSAFKAADTTTKPVTVIKEKSGHTYKFRVRAVDDHDIGSGWVEGTDVVVS